MVEETNDAELIERARRLRSMIGPSGADRYTVEAAKLVQLLADRLTALTTPDPWRRPSEPPTILERVFCRVGSDRVEVGYRTRGFACGWADDEGRCLPGVTGWQPIIRPKP